MDAKSSNAAAKKAGNVSPSPRKAGRRFTFPVSKRLLKPSEFRRVYDEGSKQVGRHMVMWSRAVTSGDAGKVGVVASKKTGNAVLRARNKRRLRELYRRNQFDIRQTHDLVFVARRGLHRAEWSDLVEEFLMLLDRADLTALPSVGPSSPQSPHAP